MQWAPVAQAVLAAMPGPLRPCWIATLPACERREREEKEKEKEKEKEREIRVIKKALDRTR